MSNTPVAPKLLRPAREAATVAQAAETFAITEREPIGGELILSPDSTPVFEFVTDPDAEPGNVVPALARLLIDLARRNVTHKEGDENGSKKSEYGLAV